MQNSDNKYELLKREACDTLGMSYQELKEKYKDYPVWLMEYINGNIYERVMEICFDKEDASISISFNTNNFCNVSILYFDNLNDEDLFIEYLNKVTQYDFKRSRWIIADCYLMLKPTKHEMAFCYYK